MKLLIICIDGLDPFLSEKWGFPKMPYEKKIYIPKIFHIGDSPHTLKIWGTIFSGEILHKTDEEIREFWAIPQILKGWKVRKFLRRFPYYHKIHRILNKYVINTKSIREKIWGKDIFYNLGWFPIPFNVGTKTIFDNYNSICWNIPTINPEFMFHIPFEFMFKFRSRLYHIFKMVSINMIYSSFELGAVYTHYLDTICHLRMKDKVKETYLDLDNHIRFLKDKCNIMVISDHGTDPEIGYHLHYAYYGCTRPIKAENFFDIQKDIDKIMKEV